MYCHWQGVWCYLANRIWLHQSRSGHTKWYSVSSADISMVRGGVHIHSTRSIIQYGGYSTDHKTSLIWYMYPSTYPSCAGGYMYPQHLSWAKLRRRQLSGCLRCRCKSWWHNDQQLLPLRHHSRKMWHNEERLRRHRGRLPQSGRTAEHDQPCSQRENPCYRETQAIFTA